MSRISVNLEKCLKQLNPNMILRDKLNEVHRVKTWLKYLDRNLLKRDASVESDIYNEGRLEVRVFSDYGGALHLLSQTPLTGFAKKYF